MTNEKLAAVAGATGPVGLAVSWLATAKDYLEALLLLVTIFATLASGLYYTSKWLRESRDAAKRNGSVLHDDDVDPAP